MTVIGQLPLCAKCGTPSNRHPLFVTLYKEGTVGSDYFVRSDIFCRTYVSPNTSSVKVKSHRRLPD